MTDAGDAIGLVLRHEYGRVVAALMREFGGARLALIEDGLAQAMVEALAAWRTPPPNPRAWLHRAARHRIIDELRRTSRAADMPELSVDDDVAPALADDLGDDELRALFACAHPSIPLQSQLVFALRTLAGFSTHEIATRLVTTDENVQKRFERAREALATVDVTAELAGEELHVRTDAVLRMLYVLFTEGYFASSGDQVLRLELCVEAIRLVGFLVDRSADARALLALFHLHHARRDARARAVLVEEQDRSLYRRDEMAIGLSLLMAGAPLRTKYQLEAAIAAEHAFAPTFAETRWLEIVRLYDALAQVEPSPLHALHGAIAASYAEGPAAGLARLEQLRPPTWLSGSHLWLATYADMYARDGKSEIAREYYEKAIAIAPPIEREVLRSRRAKL